MFYNRKSIFYKKSLFFFWGGGFFFVGDVLFCRGWLIRVALPIRIRINLIRKCIRKEMGFPIDLYNNYIDCVLQSKINFLSKSSFFCWGGVLFCWGCSVPAEVEKTKCNF